MNSSDVIFGAFIGVGGAIIGALIAGILTYCSGKKLIQKTHENDLEILDKAEFNEASAKFRYAFVTAIRLLEDPRRGNDASSTRDIFLNNIPAHCEAYILFRHHLSDERRAELDKTWKEYDDWSNYFSGGSMEKQKEDRKVLLERIKNLISFAV